jgi:hypothetical protein
MVAVRSLPFAVVALAALAAPGCGSSGSVSASPDASSGLTPAADAAGTEPPNEASPPSDDASSPSPPPPTDAGTAYDVVVVDAQPTFLGDAGLPRTMTITNQCTQTIWLSALPTTTLPGGQAVAMQPGAAFAVGLPNGWSGRFWGRAGCTTTGGKLTCETDPFPSSLAELTLTNMPDSGLDFYDVSLVDGFNLPIEIVAVGHTPDAAHPYDCGDPICAMNLDTTCPAVLQDKNGQGQVVACANDECKVLGDNDAQSPDCIYPNEYTRFFKTACPTAYSYPYDDPTSTFTCKGLDYAIVFCP